MSTATESPPTAPAETGMTLAPSAALQDYSNANMYDRISDITGFIAGFGKAIHDSHMFGTLAVAQGQVIAAILVSERKGPHWFLQTFHLVDGKITMRADRMLGNFVQAGGKYKVLQRTSDVAEIEVQHNGNKCKFAFTFNEAQEEPFCRDKKGGIKTNYATPRARSQMLWARVVSDAIRTVAPEIVAGCYVPEDLGLMADDDSPRSVEETVPGPALATAPPAAPAQPQAAPPSPAAPASVAPFIGTPSPAQMTAEDKQRREWAQQQVENQQASGQKAVTARQAAIDALPADLPDRASIVQLDVISEYKFIGLQVTDRPASKEGWRECKPATGNAGEALVNEISGAYYDRDQKLQLYFAEFLFTYFRYATPEIARKYLADRAAKVKTSPPPLRDIAGGLIDMTKPQSEEKLHKLIPDAPPPVTPEPAPFDTGDVKLVNVDQLNEMRDLKTKLAIADDVWKGKVLAKYGAATAKALTFDQAETLLKNMRVKLEGQQKSNELSEWANGATVPKTTSPN